jgi:hypothetical protein
MLILIGVTACIWFGAGIRVGYTRGKRAYALELASYPATGRLDPGSIQRGAMLRSIAVFLGWTVAGLVGAIVWAALWIALLVAQVTAEDHLRREAKRKDTGIVSALVLLGVVSIGRHTAAAIERNVDDCVIYLAVITCLIVGSITYYAMR